MKRLFRRLSITAASALMAAVLMFGGAKTLAAYAADAPKLVPYDVNGDGETGTDEEAYELEDAEDLYWFADAVNNHWAEYKNANAYLTGNITVNENLLTNLITVKEDGTAEVDSGKSVSPWVPIGNSNKLYAGMFDGKGYTISGLYFDEEKDFAGLFGYNAGIIKNVTISDTYFHGKKYIGGICGFNDDGTVENCICEVTIKGAGYMAGICGNCCEGTIRTCYYSGGSVIGSGDNVGGICGDNYGGTVENCRCRGNIISSANQVGGICGVISSGGTIEDCHNIGNITVSGRQVGGVCGYSAYNCTIRNSSNEGDVTATDNYASDIGGICGNSDTGIIENSYNKGSVSGNAYIGGICGHSRDNQITNCYSESTVTSNVNGEGNGYVGGLLGYGNSVEISNCYCIGDVSGYEYIGGFCGYGYGCTISDCYTVGSVSGTAYVGGFCGYLSDDIITITNCFYPKNANIPPIGNNKSVDSDAITEMTDNQLADGEVCWLLNGGENQTEKPVFFQNLSGEKDALPVLDNTHSNVYYSNFCKVYSNKQHKIVPKEKVNETCTTTGHAAYWQCEGCGKAFSNEDCTIDIINLKDWLEEDGFIPALGHKLTPTAQVDATCTKDGCKAYWYCSECKTYFADKDCKTKIADLEAWKSKDGKIEKGQHKGGTATCTEKAKCEICGAEYGTVEGHKYAEAWNFDAENHWHECEVCHDKKDVAAHTLVTTITNAGIGVEGKIETICTDCNNIIKTDLIPAIATVKLSQTSYTYNKKAQKPSVIVTDSEGTVIANTNYTVKYSSGRKKVGKYKVTVTFTGNYTGSVELTFTINPPKTSISKVKAGKKSFTVNWSKKTTEVTGYQIQYSTSSKFKTKTKTVTVKSAKDVTKTINKLSGNKKYYVRVRTYKTVGKTKYYSDWSSAKAVKTKK